MRVISLVPSLTETLIECGVEVVGRTRFCIHPAHRVGDIAVVGGTKGVDWQKCARLKPDLVVFDKEENTKPLAQQCPFPWWASHVESLDSLAPQMRELAQITGSEKLIQFAESCDQLVQADNRVKPDWQCLPGQLKPLHNARTHYSKIRYIIWRQSWMSISRETFIGSVLAKLGFAGYLFESTAKYPQLDEDEMSEPDTFYLFSSEPYRFLRYSEDLLEQGFNGAIVDGELYSWFGVRSVRLIRQYLQQ